MIALLLPALAYAVDESELLPPEQAFALTVEADAPRTIRLSWDIAEGYYLYKGRLGFKSGTDEVAVGEADLPAGAPYEDEFFGKVETYRGRVAGSLPIQSRPDGPLTFDLQVQYQGCADVGVCYPPERSTVSVELPRLRPAANVLGLGNEPAGLGFIGSEEPLPEDEAFLFEAIATAPDEILARWTIAPEHYVYREQFRFGLEAEGAELGAVVIPRGEPKTDEHFGAVEVFYDQVEIPVRVDRESTQAQTVALTARYQGCREAGICYPPIEKTLQVALPAGAGTANEPPNVASLQAESAPGLPVSEQDRLAMALGGDRRGLTLLTFFGLGLLLAFTPCVFPMVPILSGIIAGQGDRITTRKAFSLSLIYVLAMALTYTAAGVFAGLFGANLQAAFQNAWIIAGFSALFVALAFAMFGFYELQIPAAWQSRLNAMSNRQSGGTYTGVAVMGVLSALIVGPCVAAPLAGALIYIGQTGDAVLGGLALFALSLGMGAPLLVFGTSAGKLLPKAGAWMETVKAVFGVALLGLAIWMLERIVPPTVVMLLWGALAIGCAVYLGAFDRLTPPVSGWRRLWQATGVMFLVAGVLQFVGAAAGGNDWMRPLAGLGGGAVAQTERVKFDTIKSGDDLDAALAGAALSGKPVVLDFYADWCVDCRRMEKYTFPDPGVQAALTQVTPLKADVTANDEVDQALMKRLNIIGPPAILVFALNGDELRPFRVVGYQKSEKFIEHLNEALEYTGGPSPTALAQAPSEAASTR